MIEVESNLDVSRDPGRRELDAPLAIIAGSDLFDGDWYRARYADLADGNDPARHYLDHGANEDRDPGPGFSTGWYRAAYPDVTASGTNPLVHYLRHGRDERRIAQPVAAIHSKSLTSDVREVAASGIFDADWYRTRYLDVTDSGVDPLAHYLGMGWRDGCDPSPAVSTTAWLDSRPGIVNRRMHPMLRYVRDRAAGVDLVPTVRMMIDQVDLGSCAVDAAAAAAVATFAALHRGLDVRVRLKRRGRDMTIVVPGDVAAACIDVGAPLGATGTRLVDAWWMTDRDLRLRLEGGDAHLRAVQLGKDGAVVEQTMGRAGPLSFVDLRIIPLAPVLVVASGNSGEILAAAVLPFPSLFRGGLHAAESIGELTPQTHRAASHLLGQGARVRTVSILGDRANGSEPVFRPSVQAWLASVFAVDLVDSRARTSGGGLRLPPDAVPTVAVLCARGSVSAGTATGDVIVVDPASRKRTHRLSIPHWQEALTQLQPVGAMPLPRLDRMVTAAPLAVRFVGEVRSREATLLTPRALDAEGSTLGVPLVDLDAIGGVTVISIVGNEAMLPFLSLRLRIRMAHAQLK